MIGCMYKVIKKGNNENPGKGKREKADYFIFCLSTFFSQWSIVCDVLECMLKVVDSNNDSRVFF